jgi:hypothetical protein
LNNRGFALAPVSALAKVSATLPAETHEAAPQN